MHIVLSRYSWSVAEQDKSARTNPVWLAWLILEGRRQSSGPAQAGRRHSSGWRAGQGQVPSRRLSEPGDARPSAGQPEKLRAVCWGRALCCARGWPQPAPCITALRCWIHSPKHPCQPAAGVEDVQAVSKDRAGIFIPGTINSLESNRDSVMREDEEPKLFEIFIVFFWYIRQISP